MLNDPSIEEWNEAMKKTGGEGGREATVIGRMGVNDYDGKHFPLIKNTNQVAYPLKSTYLDEQEKKEGEYKTHLLFNCEGGNCSVDCRACLAGNFTGLVGSRG